MEKRFSGPLYSHEDNKTEIKIDVFSQRTLSFPVIPENRHVVYFSHTCTCGNMHRRKGPVRLSSPIFEVNIDSRPDLRGTNMKNKGGGKG